MNANEVPAIAAQLERRTPLQGLAPTHIWDSELEERIASLDVEGPYSHGVKSGLYLWNDSLHASHELSQDLHTATGSYLHGIMHRMEPDYSNAKYWFRQVGDHPVYDELKRWLAATSDETKKQWEAACPAAQAKEFNLWLTKGAWDPYIFVDLVSGALRGSADRWIPVLQRLQKVEIMLLLQYSYQQDTGGTLFETITPE